MAWRWKGPSLQTGFESFVGLFPIPMRHGLTIGEIARLFNDRFSLGAELSVAAMEGWQRDMYADETGLPWVMPSPNIPTLDSAIVYPGTVLFEGTMLSEGRGTTRPFELVGAPGMEAERFARDMNRLGLPGAYFRPAVFEPTFQKHAKQACGGCQVHVTDRTAFRPVKTGVALIEMFRRAAPERFAWRQPPYQYRARQDAVRHPLWIRAPAAADRGGRGRRGDRALVEGGRGGVQGDTREIPDVSLRHGEITTETEAQRHRGCSALRVMTSSWLSPAPSSPAAWQA